MARQAVVLVPAVPVTAPRTERTISMAALGAQVLRTIVSVETAVVGVRQVDVVVRVTGMRIQVRDIAIAAMKIQQRVPLQIAPRAKIDIQMTTVTTIRISCLEKQFFCCWFFRFDSTLGSRAEVKASRPRASASVREPSVDFELD